MIIVSIFMKKEAFCFLAWFADSIIQFMNKLTYSLWVGLPSGTQIIYYPGIFLLLNATQNKRSASENFIQFID